MIHLASVQTLQFDSFLEYQAAKPKVERIAEQAGAAVEWRDSENTAVLTAEQTLLQL